MDRSVVIDILRRIEAKAVHMELGDPIAGVANEELSDLLRSGTVVIDGVAPVCGVPVREVLVAVDVEVVAVRTEMVVHHIQDDAQSERMRRIHESLERVGIPIDMRRRKEINAVVAPVPPSRKFRERHELDECDADTREFFELPRSRVQCPFGRKCADMQFIHHLARHHHAAPSRIPPPERARVHDH